MSCRSRRSAGGPAALSVTTVTDIGPSFGRTNDRLATSWRNDDCASGPRFARSYGGASLVLGGGGSGRGNRGRRAGRAGGIAVEEQAVGVGVPTGPLR